MKKKAKARAKDSEWYDAHYYNESHPNRLQWYDMLLRELKKSIHTSDTILEVGCGESPALQILVEEKYIPAEQVFGIDQSARAIEHIKQFIPEGNFQQGDLYELPYKNEMFDKVCMMEVIEHVEDPTSALSELFRVTKKDGFLFLSFPNFSVFPWSVARWFADILHTPRLINKQPIDNIYTINQVVEMAQKAGFAYVSTTGVTYLTALLTPLESLGDYLITRTLNSLGLSARALHPLLRFKKL